MASPRAPRLFRVSRFSTPPVCVRSGPTAVRQLADWGANVIIKNEAVPDQAGSESRRPALRVRFPEPTYRPSRN